jgi:hypothetical protein
MPAFFCARDGVFRLWSRRVNHADQARKHQALFDTLVRTSGMFREIVLFEPATSDAKRPEGLAGECFVDLRNLRTTCGGERPPSVTEDFERTSCEQHVWRPLSEDNARMCLIGVAMDGAHQLALGGERDFADSWQAFIKVV